jgi:aspartyl-tRNA synthetase
MFKELLKGEEDGVLEGLLREDDPFLWVTEFPLFVSGESCVESAHHPFTRPLPHHLPLIYTQPLLVLYIFYIYYINLKSSPLLTLKLDSHG